MTTKDDLWDAFKAGFQATGEGFNGEYPPTSDEQIRQRFECWYCDEHEYGDWWFVRDNGFGDRKLYRRECVHCGHRRQGWRDA